MRARRSFARLLIPTRLTVLLTGASLLVACAGTDAIEIATPTATPPPSPSPVATQPASGAVNFAEDIDFTDPEVIGPLIDHFGGGSIEPLRVQYVDLTHDGRIDAFVIVESGGTMGDLGAALLGIEGGRPVVLGYVESGGRVELRFPEVGGGIVVTTEGVWEPADPLCCPSRLQERTWEWRDNAFVIVDEQVVENPDADSTPR